ncbi:MAG: UDP-N-acetylmuramate dehydrogenase [Melioribacter sp.]|uniref:UDP-N-acetylmuramate dehydrogenase n=1 Tax=Rosettibacter primus TaxID=3111523 RepID=UPI00247B3A73|nr:UDP-N-acetylmuramate dehydrogenase [Melioribacter sp.]
MNLYENYSLKHLNTFNIDVKAKYFLEVFNEHELTELINEIQGQKNVLILGAGSNILFTKDYDGFIIKYISSEIKVLFENENHVIIKADAGVVWDDLVSYTVKKNYYGIENLSLIPGTAGAAPVQNIGAYGAEISNVIDYVEGYILDKNEKKILYRDECLFNYRDSIFKNELKNKFIITSVVLRLKKEKVLNISYRDIQNYFQGRDYHTISIQDVRDAIINIRKSKLPDYTKLGNAGSFFKNPEIDFTLLELIKKEYPDIPYHQINDKYKIPAAWLIEKCGYKGKRQGNTGTYEKQALVIINYGNATGEEIKNFADEIKQAVKNKFNIDLGYEVNII